MPSFDAIRNFFNPGKVKDNSASQKPPVQVDAPIIPEIKEKTPSVIELFRETLIKGVSRNDINRYDSAELKKETERLDLTSTRTSVFFNDLKRYFADLRDGRKEYGHWDTLQQLVEWDREQMDIDLFGDAKSGIGFNPIYEIEDFVMPLGGYVFPREQLPVLMESFGITIPETALTSGQENYELANQLREKAKVSQYKNFHSDDLKGRGPMTRYEMPTNIAGVSFFLDFPTDQLQEHGGGSEVAGVANPAVIGFDFAPSFLYKSLACDSTKDLSGNSGMGPLFDK